MKCLGEQLYIILIVLYIRSETGKSLTKNPHTHTHTPPPTHTHTDTHRHTHTDTQTHTHRAGTTHHLITAEQ